MNIRKAHIDDLPAIVAIYNQAVTNRTVTDDSKPITVTSRRQWFANFDHDHPIWVITDDEQVVGWCSLAAFYDHPAYDYSRNISIYLSNEAQGRGLGYQLLTFVCETVQKEQLPIKTIISYIYEQNLPSQRLFAKAGFEKLGELRQIARTKGKWRTLMIYSRSFDYEPQ